MSSPPGGSHKRAPSDERAPSGERAPSDGRAANEDSDNVAPRSDSQIQTNLATPDKPDPLLTWDADGQPYSGQFGDVYFSKTSGIDESRYVFLHHNHLPDRWRKLPPTTAFSIGETGFGTGLNFLVAWELWRASAPADARLHFVSVEKYPLSRQQLQQALRLWPELATLAEQLVAQYPPMPARGFQRLVFDDGRVHLTLILDDAVAGLNQLLPTEAGAGLNTEVTWAGVPVLFDAWFLDGFAPAKNPGMWTQPLFYTLARLSKPGASFATFTAAGIVKQGLTAAGFNLQKVAGYGRKRHMLRGELQAAAAAPLAQEPKDTAWHLTEQQIPAHGDRRIAIVGAGLAGCHTARTLAERGYQVMVFDRGAIAGGASGNPQGVVYAKASSQDQPLTRFNITALQFACRYYTSRIGFGECGDASGVVHLAQTDKQAAEYHALAAHYEHEPEFVRWLDQDETARECGLPLSSGGLLFSQAGWLQPAALCRALLSHPNIRCWENQPVERLRLQEDQWQLLDHQGNPFAMAPRVIIANANDALHFGQTRSLPVKPIRGQITRIPATDESGQLQRVICGRGYIAPAVQEQHCAGASFNLESRATEPDPTDDADNLAHIAELSPVFGRNDVRVSSSRVSFRCTTPDYLPLVGPAPIAADFLDRYARLRHNARAIIDASGSYYPGLFINIGHGSRGLVYTPLSAELLTAMISGEPLPLERDMVRRLHPARFLIRDLKRNKTAPREG